MNDSVYCSMPWTQLMIGPSGDYKICCFSGDHDSQTHGYCLDENDKPMNVLTHSMEEAMNSKTSASIRKYQSENRRHPECSVCWNKDDDKVKSGAATNSFRVMRTFEQFPKWDIKVTEDLKIRSLDLRFTNVCNLKCIMCTPLYSSLWYEDHTKLYGNTFGDKNVKYLISVNSDGKYSSNMPNWHDTEIWKQRFDKVKGDLKHLYITGGEPFIIKGHLEMLDDLIACDLAKNIVIEYDTNLTVINKKILERFSKFKRIYISVSFDDIGDRYNYMRFPGDFDKVSANLKYLIENKSNNVTIKSISCCLGIVNMFAPFRFEKYIQENNIEVKSAYRLLRYPTHFDVKYLPKKVKDVIIQHYQNSNSAAAKESLVIGHLLNNYDAEDLNMVRAHMNYLDKLDTLRSTNWRETFPETYELLKEYE